MTFVFALLSGLGTGFLLRIPIFQQIKEEELFEDSPFWEIPEDSIEEKQIGVNLSPPSIVKNLDIFY